MYEIVLTRFFFLSENIGFETCVPKNRLKKEDLGVRTTTFLYSQDFFKQIFFSNSHATVVPFQKQFCNLLVRDNLHKKSKMSKYVPKLDRRLKWRF